MQMVDNNSKWNREERLLFFQLRQLQLNQLYYSIDEELKSKVNQIKQGKHIQHFFSLYCFANPLREL
jgi:hypothetical protein